MKETAERVRMRFSEWLQEHRKGHVDYEASEALQKVVEAVRETGKAGEVTVRIKVQPFKGDRNRMIVTDEIKAKAPDPDREAAIWYAAEGGKLQREDPRQQRLDLD
jgi:hypothetical protein